MAQFSILKRKDVSQIRLLLSLVIVPLQAHRKLHSVEDIHISSCRDILARLINLFGAQDKRELTVAVSVSAGEIEGRRIDQPMLFLLRR